MFGHFYNQGMRKMTVKNFSVKFLITYKLKEQDQIVQYNLLECL